MSEVLLDREGTLAAPAGYRAVSSEVEFLRHATEDVPLLIRGERLCAWAYEFYTSRGRPCRYVESPAAKLRRSFPQLTDEQVAELGRMWGSAADLPERIRPEDVLARLYPQDEGLWMSAPSLAHAARWLVWLTEHSPGPVAAVLLRDWAMARAAQAHDTPEAMLYQVADADEARAKLLTWLGAEDTDPPPAWGEFPISAPAGLLRQAKEQWRLRLIRSGGATLADMLALPLPLALKQLLAESAAEYFNDNPTTLTRERLALLRQSYCLNDRMIASLERRLPPPEPEFPAVPDERGVLDWFSQAYLPYRRWQAQHGDDRARMIALGNARCFARWYLTRYPQWLLKPEEGWIAFQRVATLARDDALTLCVVLDGLPAWDAEDFVRELTAHIERLTLLNRDYYCFAPFPTITEFAKNALLKGVSPRLAKAHEPLAAVISEREDMVARVQGDAGGLSFWNVSQPDAVYHFVAAHNRAPDIQSELTSVRQKLGDLVEAVPDDRVLRVVITTDHGRLLNARAESDKPVPTGMRAHGRAAWGRVNRSFPEDGFLLDEADGLCLVHGERFGVGEDVAIAWDEGSFQNDKRTGYEAYPHGGLFPEEAIIPWFVFERDAQLPEVDIKVSGTGEAGAKGELVVSVTNPSRIALICFMIALSHDASARAETTWEVRPMSPGEWQVALVPWPQASALDTLNATLHFRLPSGKTFTRTVKPILRVDALYTRDDSLLTDLDL